MKTKILSGLICCLGIYSATAQTITAPIGTPLTITNSVDVTLATGNVNVPADGSFNIGGYKIMKIVTNNMILGRNSGPVVGSGVFNTFIGENTGFLTSSGNNNLFVGYNSGGSNTSGSSNMFFGSNSGFNNTTGLSNSFVGTNAGYQNTIGSDNLFLGSESGRLNVSGLSNTFIGNQSGYNNTSGNNNTFIGFDAKASGANAAILTNATIIGASATVTTSNTVVLGNNATVVIGASAASATPAKLEVTGTTAGKSGVKFTSLATGALTGALNNLRTGGFLTVDNTGEIVWAATGASRLGNPDGITSAEGTATFSDNNWSLANGYLKNTSKRGVVIGEGITTMPEGYSFYVADGILTEKVKVAIKGTDEWADYVFGKNYNRMSLTEVAKYIEKNKHLPNVPSAAEMVQNGNDLHKTDVKLLEKIEELTLYMIEMKKENEQLKKDVDSLKKRRK